MEARLLLSVETAASADAFVDSIGVNTHFNLSNVYAQAATQTALGQLGIHHIRDNAQSVAYSRVANLYSTYGIKTDIAVGNFSLTPTDQVHALENAWAESIEGANEPDNFIRSYEGFTDSVSTNDFAATRRFQTELYDAAKADPLTATKPVLSPAMGNPVRAGSLSGLGFDDESVHPYPATANPLSWKLDSTFLPATDLMNSSGTPKPVIATESGYHTGTSSGSISETTKAKYLPRLLAGYFSRGIQRTYLYEFADEGTNPAHIEENYGLVNNDLSPKASYTAIQNMISLLNESTWNSGTQTWNTPTFTPGALDYTLSGNTTGVQKLLLQKSNGDFYLLLWNEAVSYDASTNTDIAVPTQNVTLTFNTPLASAAQYSLSSTTPTQSFANPTQINIDVPDEVVILKLTPRTSQSPVPVGFSDNFESDSLNIVPTGWSQPAGDDWEVKNGTSPANQWVENRNTTGARSISHSLGTTVSGSWVMDLDYTWRYDGAAGNTGYHGLYDMFDVVDASNNGYRISSYQGDSNQSTYDNTLTNIYKLTGGTAGPALGTGTGYNRAGWVLRGLSAPDWRHMRLAFDAGSHTLSVYEDPDGDGVFQVVAQATDSSYGSFTQLVLRANTVIGTVAPMFDNITMSTPTVTVQTTDASAGESPVDQGQFTITRTGSTAAPLTVAYTLGGSATNGTDYSSLSGTVIIPAGSASATITVAPLSDATVEGDESVVVTLTEIATYHVGNLRTAELPIIDYAPDLVITSISWTPANPLVGDLVRLKATVKNIGNAPTPAGVASKIGFIFDGNGGASVGVANYTASIAPGQSVTLTSSAGGVNNGGQWSASGVFHVVTAWVDANASYNGTNGLIAEKSDLNNQAFALMSVAQSRLSDDFSGGTVDSPPPDWTASGSGWAIKNDGGQNFLEFTANGTQSVSRTLSTPATGSWSLDFKHTWRWGGTGTNLAYGQYTNKSAVDLVDAAGNGYRIQFNEGTSGSPGLTTLSVYRITVGVVSSTAIQSTLAWDRAGWKSAGASTPDWRAVRITFDKGSQRLTVLGDLQGNGVYTSLLSFVDTLAPTSIAKLSLVAVSVINNTSPEFDDIRFDSFI